MIIGTVEAITVALRTDCGFRLLISGENHERDRQHNSDRHPHLAVESGPFALS
jgi:hypothetical protein